MRSHELKVSPASDYYLHTPSTLAREIYFYPMQIGYFYYEPEYSIKRNSYDSFLLIHMVKGSCQGSVAGKPFSASKNQLVFIDCYAPHQYGSSTPWEAAWIHFDGPLARAYYDLITKHNGCILTPHHSTSIYQTLTMLTNLFRESKLVRESVLSEHITGMLNQLISQQQGCPDSSLKTTAIDSTTSYMNKHFKEPLSLTFLASRVALSPYYFTRIFTEETGFTPHQYLIATRMNAAKFLLKSSETSIKDIAFTCGFNSESGFCSTFKKWENMTPSQYRKNILSP